MKKLQDNILGLNVIFEVHTKGEKDEVFHDSRSIYFEKDTLPDSLKELYRWLEFQIKQLEDGDK